MLGIDAVPSLGNGQIGRSEKMARVTQDKFVSLGLVKDIDGQPVFV
jgi:hypothetical protein